MTLIALTAGQRLVVAVLAFGFVLVLLPVGRLLDRRWDATLRRPDAQDRASHYRLMEELRRSDGQTVDGR